MDPAARWIYVALLVGSFAQGECNFSEVSARRSFVAVWFSDMFMLEDFYCFLGRGGEGGCFARSFSRAVVC